MHLVRMTRHVWATTARCDPGLRPHLAGRAARVACSFSMTLSCGNLPGSKLLPAQRPRCLANTAPRPQEEHHINTPPSWGGRQNPNLIPRGQHPCTDHRFRWSHTATHACTHCARVFYRGEIAWYVVEPVSSIICTPSSRANHMVETSDSPSGAPLCVKPLQRLSSSHLSFAPWVVVKSQSWNTAHVLSGRIWYSRAD